METFKGRNSRELSSLRETNVQAYLQQKQNKYLQLHQTYQPIIIVVGENLQRYETLTNLSHDQFFENNVPESSTQEAQDCNTESHQKLLNIDKHISQFQDRIILFVSSLYNINIPRRDVQLILKSVSHIFKSDLLHY